MSVPDYYRILGVAPYSEDVVIQAAYRALMRRYHPDTNESSDAGRRATEINEAYAVLSDANRKARYDAERKAARSKSQSASGTNSRSGHTPPPPPPPPPRADDQTQSSSPIEWRGAWIAGSLVAGFILLSAVLANSEISSSQGDTDYVVENLTAENLVIENDLIPEETSAPPLTLASIPQTPIRYDDVESAAVRFSQLLRKNGMSGARSLSEKCHAGVLAEPKWSSADWCAAFDYAAAFVDAEVSRAGGWKPMPYFQFQAENQADRYKEAGAADYFASTRLLSLKRAAEAAAEDAVRQQIADSKASDREEGQNAVPAGATYNQMRVGSASTSAILPSFDCGRASTPSEKLVCSDPLLAELDRNMSAQYYQALRDATSEQRSLLERTAKRFISYRDRCSGASCISQTYLSRMREIEDIKEGRWRG